MEQRLQLTASLLFVSTRSKSILEDVVPLSPKGTETGYLSDMVNYLAAVGDVTSTWDDGPTEGHNYFAMLGQEPQEILSSLVSRLGAFIHAWPYYLRTRDCLFHLGHCIHSAC